MDKKQNKNMYRLYKEYKKTLKQSNETLRKRQKANAEMREKYYKPFQREDYNYNKADITHWNSMINDLIDDMKMIEMYLDFEDRYYLHKEYNDIKSMIYNQNSYEGIVPIEELFGETIPDIAEIVCNVELQEEIVEMLDEVLNDRQRKVIRMYFWDDMTQEEIGNELGISRQAITKIVADSLNILRNTVKYSDLCDFLRN